MENKTILVNYLGRKGGGAAYAYEMTKSLIDNGCKVYAIISNDTENFDKWKKLDLAELISIPTYNGVSSFIRNSVKFWLFRRKKIKEKFKFQNIDVVYTPMIQPWSLMINSIFKDSQHVVTVHDPIPHIGTSFVYKWICRKTAIKADKIVILSEKFRKFSIKYYRKKNECVYVIPHGIFDYYKTFPKKKTKTLYDKSKINFLFFGRITKYKGLHVLAKAYEKLSREYENVTLSIVGNGNFQEYREDFNNLSNVNVINRWINDDEVGNFFEGKNIVTVLPYVEATQSGVIPIAMEYKSLVIASNTGGLSEQIEDKVTGYLCEPGDPFDLYLKMKFVVDHFDEQKQIIENAYKYIHSLSWDVLGLKLLEVIEQ